ncbi:hypothetical protein V3C99_018308, partial [Haemonchus contortus]
GPFIVSNSTSRSWYKKFKNGHFDWTEKPRFRRLAELNDDYLLKLVEEDSGFSTHQLKQELIAITTQQLSICIALGRHGDSEIWIRFGLGGHDLQMKRDSCLNLMTFRRTFAWPEDLVTGDKKCVSYLNHTRKRQWLRCVEHGIPTSNPEFLPQKVMPSVCSHSTGSFTGTFYHRTPLSAQKPSVLCGPDCYSSKRETRESLFSPRQCSPTLFEGDQKKLQSLRWHVMAHPSYSPDLTPTDYYLLLPLSDHPKNKKFDYVNQLETYIDEFSSSKPQEFYASRNHKLPGERQYLVDNDGAYIC